MIEDAVSGLDGVRVEPFKGLMVEFARAKGTRIILRGVRMISDFEYEFQMALTNRRLAPDIETIFMMPNEKYSYISSRLIKEAASLGADTSSFLPQSAVERLNAKLKRTK